MKKIAYYALSALGFLAPAFAFAAQNGGGSVNNIQDLGQLIIDLINTVFVPLIFALAFVVFLWGVFQYFILGGADEEKRESGKGLMIWGLIGFFVMVSVWGLVNLLVGTVNLNNNGLNQLPTAPSTGQ